MNMVCSMRPTIFGLISLMSLFSCSENNIALNENHDEQSQIVCWTVIENKSVMLGKHAEYNTGKFSDGSEHAELIVYGRVDDSHFNDCIRMIQTGWVDELTMNPDSVPLEQRDALIKAWTEFIEYDGFDPEDCK